MFSIFTFVFAFLNSAVPWIACIEYGHILLAFLPSCLCIGEQSSLSGKMWKFPTIFFSKADPNW